jgi:hypothetical protein
MKNNIYPALSHPLNHPVPFTLKVKALFKKRDPYVFWKFMIEKEDVVAIIYELRKMVNMSPFFHRLFLFRCTSYSNFHFNQLGFSKKCFTKKGFPLSSFSLAVHAIPNQWLKPELYLLIKRHIPPAL